MTVDHYTYRVTWSADDEEYVGLCAEFPSLSWLAPTQEEAFSGIRNVVADCVADMRANNETAPEPLADRSYSGRFVVRVPPETHRAPGYQGSRRRRQPQSVGQRTGLPMK